MAKKANRLKDPNFQLKYGCKYMPASKAARKNASLNEFISDCKRQVNHIHSNADSIMKHLNKLKYGISVNNLNSVKNSIKNGGTVTLVADDVGFPNYKDENKPNKVILADFQTFVEKWDYSGSFNTTKTVQTPFRWLVKGYGVDYAGNRLQETGYMKGVQLPSKIKLVYDTPNSEAPVEDSNENTANALFIAIYFPQKNLETGKHDTITEFGDFNCRPDFYYCQIVTLDKNMKYKKKSEPYIVYGNRMKNRTCVSTTEFLYRYANHLNI